MHLSFTLPSSLRSLASIAVLVLAVVGCGRIGVTLLPWPPEAGDLPDAASTDRDSGAPVDSSTPMDSSTPPDSSTPADAGDSATPPPTGVRIFLDLPANGSTLTNFPVRVQLDTQALISQGMLAADCSNLRIVGADGCTATRSFFLPQHTCNTSTTEVWVRVPQLLAGTREVLAVTFDSVGPASNGSQVFSFFEGFDGTSLDTARWSDYGNGTETVSNGVFQSQGVKALESKTAAVTAGTSALGIRIAAIGTTDTDVELGAGRVLDASVIWAFARDWDGVTFLSYTNSTYVINGPTSGSCNDVANSMINPSLGSSWLDTPPATATFLTAEFTYANVSGSAHATLRTSRGASLSYTAPAGCTLPVTLPVLISLDHYTPDTRTQRIDYVYVRATATVTPTATVQFSSSERCGTSP